MKKTIIVAMGSNFVIGKDNDLPWRGKLPADLGRFKNLTKGQSVVMGRKTYESIDPKFRPLPGRVNFVLTKQPEYQAPGCTVVHSLQEAFDQCQTEQLFIMGGARVYEETLPLADEIQLTLIHNIFEGDARFPHIKWSEWQVSAQEHHEPDDRNIYRYSFLNLVRHGGNHETRG